VDVSARLLFFSPRCSTLCGQSAPRAQVAAAAAAVIRHDSGRIYYLMHAAARPNGEMARRDALSPTGLQMQTRPIYGANFSVCHPPCCCCCLSRAALACAPGQVATLCRRRRNRVNSCLIVQSHLMDDAWEIEAAQQR
jgi:hypothetical protein